MSGALKFTNFTILHPHIPYKYLNHISFPSTVTATATATAVESTTILRFNHSAGRWRTAISGGRNSRHFSSDCGNKGPRTGLFCNFETDIGVKMCAPVNGKVRDQSDVSPPQSEIGKPAVHPTKLLTLPTILTIGRVVAVPLLVGTFYAESWWGPVVTTAIFILAAFTDWLDGYLARKMNLGTPFGAFLDPVADKLMVAATLILLCTKPFEAGMFGQAPWLLTVPAIAIIGREITMSAVREWAAAQDRKLLEAVAVNNLGKWKTAAQMTALTILLAARDGSLIGAGTFANSGVILLYISAWLALWSLVVYMRKISKVLLR